MPKSHKLIVPGSPIDGQGLKERTIKNLGDRGKVTEFFFDERKNLGVVTIETPGDDDLSFQEVAGLLGDLPLYQVGPINLARID